MRDPGAPLLRKDALEGLARLDGGAGEILRETIRLFREMAPGHLAGIRQGLAEADSETAERLAHNLKAAAGTLGAESMKALCAELEREIARGASEAFALVDRVETEYPRVERALLGELARASQSAE